MLCFAQTFKKIRSYKNQILDCGSFFIYEFLMALLYIELCVSFLGLPGISKICRNPIFQEITK